MEMHNNEGPCASVTYCAAYTAACFDVGVTGSYSLIAVPLSSVCNGLEVLASSDTPVTGPLPCVS